MRPVGIERNTRQSKRMKANRSKGGRRAGGYIFAPPTHTHKNMFLYHAWVLVHGWLMWTSKLTESVREWMHLGRAGVGWTSEN